ANYTWHANRHTFISRLIMAGVPLRTVQELAGHKTITMTCRYAHLAPEHQLDAVRVLDGWGRKSGKRSATRTATGGSIPPSSTNTKTAGRSPPSATRARALLASTAAKVPCYKAVMPFPDAATLYEISSEPGRLDLDAYWSPGIPREVVAQAMRNSVCFGAYAGQAQVGFARVVTDRTTFAYLADVFVLPEHRGRGLSKRLMQAVRSHPHL